MVNSKPMYNITLIMVQLNYIATVSNSVLKHKILNGTIFYFLLSKEVLLKPQKTSHYMLAALISHDTNIAKDAE